MDAQMRKPTGALTQAGSENNLTHTAIVADLDADSKRFAMLKAKAAIAGHTLTQVRTGYMLSKWTHSKHVNDLDTVETLLKRMGACK